MNSPQAVGLCVLLPVALICAAIYGIVCARSALRRANAIIGGCLAELDHDDLMAVADVVAVQPTVGADCLEPNLHILTGCPRCYAVLEVMTEITGLANVNLEFMRITQGIAS